MPRTKINANCQRDDTSHQFQPKRVRQVVFPMQIQYNMLCSQLINKIDASFIGVDQCPLGKQNSREGQVCLEYEMNLSI